MRIRLRLILPIFFLVPSIGYSQVLKGRVLSESGATAAGVTVHFQNKANSILTNSDGSFKIMATKLPDTLVFSAPGFESYKVVITEKNIKDPGFEVVLLNSRTAMDEVVVASMGTSKEYKIASEKRSKKGEDVVIRGIGTGSASTTYRAGEPVVIGYSSSRMGEVRGDIKYRFAGDSTGLLNRNNAKSKILTAGEVNDFNKWKMWEDYNTSEFKTYSESWGMWTSNRYSVQLTDKKRNAIINEPVYLINKFSKDTVWRAYTDNTGKAELWAGFVRKDSIPVQADYFISDRNGNVINNPSAFANGVNLFEVNKSCQFSNEVDIAFVVDATGSMGDEIEFLKLELEDVMRSTMEKYQSLTINAASVFYRDKGDAYLTKNVAFSDDILKTLNFIKLQNSGGGGDYPEAVDDALATALDSLQWHTDTRTRLLFLILDAPPHNEAKERIRQQTLKAAAMGIRIIPIACSGTDKSTEFLLRSMALATNGTYAFLTNHSGVGNKHIEPTTDKYDVELLNSLLQRIIGQFLYAKDCSKENATPPQEIPQPANILSLKIFPNPTSGQFTIESNKDIKEIFIADFTGKILMRVVAGNKKGRWQVNISGYPSGAYLVKYITTDNKWGAEKIILMQ